MLTKACINTACKRCSIINFLRTRRRTGRQRDMKHSQMQAPRKRNSSQTASNRQTLQEELKHAVQQLENDIDRDEAELSQLDKVVAKEADWRRRAARAAATADVCMLHILCNVTCNCVCNSCWGHDTSVAQKSTRV